MLASEGVKVQMSRERQMAHVEFKIWRRGSAVHFCRKPVADRMFGPNDWSIRRFLVGSCERITIPRLPPEAGGDACAI